MRTASCTRKHHATQTNPPPEPAAPATTTTTLLHPTRDELTHAAYLNFLRRKQLGLPGDAAADWLEAERQIARA